MTLQGSDDDGSGTVTTLEAYRTLLASDFKPNRTVEFHWYSAEVRFYYRPCHHEQSSQTYSGDLSVGFPSSHHRLQGPWRQRRRHELVTARVKRGTREEVGVITDYTNGKLTQPNKDLVEEYLSIPFVETKCGYACSDHSSLEGAGYPAIFTIETRERNPELEYPYPYR